MLTTALHIALQIVNLERYALTIICAQVSITGTRQSTPLLERLAHLQKDTINKLVTASLLTLLSRTPNVLIPTLVTSSLNNLRTSVSLKFQIQHQQHSFQHSLLQQLYYQDCRILMNLILLLMNTVLTII